MSMNPNPLQDIRIGTLVSGLRPDPADYIRQILPHGFESFSITFWQTLGGVDLPELAARGRATCSVTRRRHQRSGHLRQPAGDHADRLRDAATAGKR